MSLESCRNIHKPLELVFNTKHARVLRRLSPSLPRSLHPIILKDAFWHDSMFGARRVPGHSVAGGKLALLARP